MDYCNHYIAILAGVSESAAADSVVVSGADCSRMDVSQTFQPPLTSTPGKTLPLSQEGLWEGESFQLFQVLLCHVKVIGET